MSAILDHHGNAFRAAGHGPYEAGSRGRRVARWMAPSSGPNSAATANAQTMRNRSRQQYRDNGYAQSGINKLVSNIIGTGIKPRSTVEDKNWQRDAQRVFEEWGSQCDPEGVLDIYGIQAQACNAWLLGGEAFIRRRPRRESDGLPVPLQIQVMEAEQCPVHHHGRARNGNRIRHGIEYNAIGQRAAYWFYKSHPGDISALSVDDGQLVRVPAADVIHLFDPVRPGQSRGVVRMAPVLLRMYDVDKYDDATLMRQQIANLFAAFVTNNSGEAPPVPNSLAEQPDAADDEAADSEPVGWEPAMIQELLEGQDIKFAAPPDAGSTYGEFLSWQLRGTAVGIDVPYELMTGDFSKINDRLARVILNDFHRRVQQQQQHIIIHQMCRRIWAWQMTAAILSGRLSAPDYARDPGQYTRAKHVPQAWRYINPVQDVQADRERIRSGIATRGDIVDERSGEDIDDHDARWASEAESADAKGLRFDSDPRWTDNSGKRLDGAKQQAEEEREDAEAGAEQS